jgi:F-type H+-transporting ATPase subunit a
MEHELWFTAILNNLLAGPVTALLNALAPIHYEWTGRLSWLRDLNFSFAWVRPADPAHPIPNYVAMEILVMLIILAGALVLRRSLSLEKPGALQHIGEVIVQFTQNMCDELIGHGGRRYVAMIGTLGVFIMLCNLIGLIPTLETPTAKIQVTLGCAVAAFLWYNFHGFRQHGVLGYLKHLCGPMLAIAIIMFPIEVISNFGRLLSLSVRLQANMLVGDQLERVFGILLPHALGAALGVPIRIVVPPMFGALHIFVSLLQAYIFMLLPAVYIGMAVAEEH